MGRTASQGVRPVLPNMQPLRVPPTRTRERDQSSCLLTQTLRFASSLNLGHTLTHRQERLLSVQAEIGLMTVERKAPVLRDVVSSSLVLLPNNILNGSLQVLTALTPAQPRKLPFTSSPPLEPQPKFVQNLPRVQIALLNGRF